MSKKTPPMPYGGDTDGGEPLFSVASATECTGMIPAAPADADEVLAYEEIYDVPLSKRQRERPLQRGPHGDPPKTEP